MSNTSRAQAAEVLGELVKANRSLAGRAASLLDQRPGSDAVALAKAAVNESLGKHQEARAALAGVNGPLAAVAQMKLGQIALAMGRDADAAASLERAIYLDADGATTDALAFRAPGPRAQLIKLYSKIGRDLAAVRLAESEQQGSRSAIGAVLRRALSSRGARTESQENFSFEPPLNVARSRTTGLTTLAEMKDAVASSSRGELLAAFVDSAARLGQYDRAMAIERLRAAEATKAEDKATIEKRLAAMAAADQARQLRLALLTRINRSNATESVYAARFLGKE